MPTESRMKRKLRRLRNERRLAYKIANQALKERNFLRAVIGEMRKIELEKEKVDKVGEPGENMVNEGGPPNAE